MIRCNLSYLCKAIELIQAAMEKGADGIQFHSCQISNLDGIGPTQKLQSCIYLIAAQALDLLHCAFHLHTKCKFLYARRLTFR